MCKDMNDGFFLWLLHCTILYIYPSILFYNLLFSLNMFFFYVSHKDKKKSLTVDMIYTFVADHFSNTKSINLLICSIKEDK